MTACLAEPLALTDADVARWRAKLAPTDERGCRLWTSSTDADGYGTFSIKAGERRRSVKAHLVAWAVEVGPFPDGLEPDHTCVRPACTSIEHIEWVTHAENQRRMAERRTHCLAGLHRWDEQVPIIRARGGRECRPCENLAQARRRAARTGRNGVVGRPRKITSGAA